MRKLATAAAVSLALASGGAFGLGLGDIDMRSALNQPMSAEIPLTSVKPGELDGMIVKLADEDAFARAGIERSEVLTGLEFSVDPSANRPVIRVTSRRPVTEPFLNFLLEVDWPQGRMVREYTVLLDPPVFMTQGPSVRDGGADRGVVAGDERAAVAPAPIERDGAGTTDEGFDVELVEAGEEVSDDALLGGSGEGTGQGEVVSLDELAGDSAPAPAGGEIVSLTDLEAPNTDAAEARAAAEAAERTAAADEPFEVELLGNGDEVGDDAGSDSAAGASGDGEVVSLDDVGASGDAGPEEVTVSRGDTLFEIAEGVTPSGASVEQTMLALLEANRSAFIDDNINLVKAGSILRVPQATEVRALSQAEALAEIGRQDDLWRQYRDNLRSRTADTQIASGPADAASDDSDADAGADDEAVDTESGLSEDARAILEAAREEVRRRDELSIVADDTSSETTASATADETDGNDAARLGEINRQLQLAREELAAARVEGDDLGEQAEELQSTSENLDALVSLRQNEIAKLEAQLAEARDAAEDTAEDVVGQVADAEGAALDEAGDAVAETAAAGADAAGDAADEALAGASEVAGEAAGALDTAVADAGDVASGALAEADGALEDAAGDTENALSAIGQELESVELVDEDSDADGSAVDAEAAGEDVVSAAAAPAAAEGPWYQSLFQDPTRLAIVGAGAVGLLGVLGTLLWRRRRQDDDDPLAGFHDEDVEFIDEDESDELQAELDAQSGVLARGQAAVDDVQGGIGDADKAAAAGAAGIAAAGAAAGAAAFGGRDEESAADAAPLDADATGGEALDKDDTISEVDVYLAYGLHGQAEELLTKAIDRQPENMEYAEKLLQTYHAQGNGEGFQRAAADYHARFGGDSNPAWEGIAAMGRELRPNEALFAAGAGGVAAIGSGQLDGPQLDDEDFLADASNGAAPSSSVSRDFGATEETLDFDMGETAGPDAAADDPEDESALMDQSLDPAFAFDEGDLEATGDFSQIASELAAEDGESLELPDLGAADASSGERALDDALTLDELDLDSTASLAANDAPTDEDALSLDLDDIGGAIDLDATSVEDTAFLDEVDLDESARGEDAATAFGADGLEGLDIADLTGDNELLNGTGAPLDGGDEMDTMMDLAKAYIDMGDKDSASNALGEIVKSGNPEQVSEAETLLRKIS